MRISDKSAEVLRTDVIKQQPLKAPDGNARGITHPILPVRQADQVQISDAGRALAARVSNAGAEAPPAEIGAERAAEIRKRVLEGAYNSLDVVDQVARRILASGEL
jgi:hypothetical protein